ncbi:homeobox domain-containing protein [Ditylenchus destructor]|nr:homeobox domain-containing protein [Ditylenchus destructor]
MLAMFQITAGRMQADGRVAAIGMANATDKDIIADKRSIWGLRNTQNDRKSSTALPPLSVHRGRSKSLLCRPIKSTKVRQEDSSTKEKTCRQDAESLLRVSEETAQPTTTPEAKENRQADQRSKYQTARMSQVKNSSCKTEASTTFSKAHENDANESYEGKLRKERDRLKAKLERRRAVIAEKDKCIEDLQRKAKEIEEIMDKERGEMNQLMQNSRRKLKEKIKELEQDVESKEAVIGEMKVERQKAYQPFLSELQEKISETQKAKEELQRVCEKWRSRNTEECERLRKEKSTLETDLADQQKLTEEYQSRTLELERLLKDKECTLSQENERRAELSEQNIELSKELSNYKIEKLFLETNLAEQKAIAEELETNIAEIKSALTEKECAWSEDRKGLCHEISGLVLKVLNKETENSTSEKHLAEERARSEEYKFKIGRLETTVLEKEQSLLKEKELQTQLYEEIANLKQQLSSTQNTLTPPLSLPSGSCNAIFSDISSNSNRCHTNLAENSNRKRNGDPNCSNSTPRKRANCAATTLFEATDEIKYSITTDLAVGANSESGNVNDGDEVAAFVHMLNYTSHERKPENVESVSTFSSTLPTPTYEDQPIGLHQPHHQAHPQQGTLMFNLSGDTSSSRSQSTDSNDIHNIELSEVEKLNHPPSLAYLDSMFKQNPNPSVKIVYEIAKNLNLRSALISGWFHHRRSLVNRNPGPSHLTPGPSNEQSCQQQSNESGNNSYKQNRVMQLDRNLKEAFGQSGGILTGKLCLELCEQNSLTSAQVERWFVAQQNRCIAQQNVFMGEQSANGQMDSRQKFDSEILEAYFQRHKYVDMNRREKLSKILGWTHPQIAQWFNWKRNCLKTRGVGQSAEPPQSDPIQQVSPGSFANFVQQKNQSANYFQMAPPMQMISPPQPLLTSYADNSPDGMPNLFTQELGPNNFPIQHLGAMPMINGERMVNCAPYYEQNRANLGMQFQPGTSYILPQNPQQMNPFHARHPTQQNSVQQNPVLHTLLTRPPHLENDYFAAPPVPSNNGPTTSQNPTIISPQFQSRE